MARQPKQRKTSKPDKNTAIDNIRHSLAHLLAAAVLKRFPGTKLGIGPTIEHGFYYDFLFPKEAKISDAILKDLEKDMRGLARQGLDFSGRKITPADAKKIFKDEPFKLDLIKEFSKENKQLTAYYTCPSDAKPSTLNPMPCFVDLCRGGHVDNTSEINLDAFTLTKLAGAYWRGDEKNPMLTRIYGIAFASKKELEEYLKMLKEAEKRDHKKLGQRLELFFFHETAPGIPYWLPKGLLILNELIHFWREDHARRGYQEVQAPLLNKKALYETSGHWEHYRENMFIAHTGEKETYALKPMNCPNAMVIFASKARSYRELPLRLSDTDRLHRYELSGTLNGLLRAREFSQDDAHIFVSEDQIRKEYGRILDITKQFYSIFNINYSFRLGTRPVKFMGDRANWNKAEKSLQEILRQTGKPYSIEAGDGAFYGPKIDILMKDSLGRDWQMGTIQLDFQIPRNFKLTYAASDGTTKTPVVIHRVIYGSLERFVGILIEHFAGAFPLWLAPVQAQVLPVSAKAERYTKVIFDKLKDESIRVELTDANETLGKRIREAELQKIPYVLVVGEKEAANNSVNVRHYRRGQEGEMRFDRLVKKLQKEIQEKII